MTAFPFKQRSHLCETRSEELASSITHGLGLALSIAGLVGMVLFAQGDTFKVVSASIFGSTLILLYLSSTLYHSFSTPKLKSFFQIIDHSCIYLLIAGSYTPITLVTLRGTLGWSIFGIIWGLALTGVLIKSLMRGKRETWWSTALYLVMGWLIVFALKPVFLGISGAGLAWLIAGGVAYSAGVIFFVWEKLRFNHAIWHLFVLAGSSCHVIAVMLYILREA